MIKKIFLLFLIFEIIIFQRILPVSAKDNNIEADFNVLTYYYVNPQPDKVPLELEKFIASERFIKDENFRKYGVYNTAYLFGRVAQLVPALITKYEDIFEKSSHEGRSFILKIFQICGNEQVKDFLTAKLKDKNFSKEKNEISEIIKEGIPIGFNPLDREIKDGSDLDFLWAEFMITGNEKAIQKIIAVLDWQDRFRNKLSDYLKRPIAIPEKEETTDILDKDYNLKCSLSTQEIGSSEDLDIFISSQLQSQEDRIERFRKVRKALNLTEEDILYMAIKGSASWSLNSNAEQHKKVFEICDAEIAKHTGTAKITLLRIAANGYASNNKPAEAIDRLKQLSLLIPKDKDVRYRLGLAYAESGNMQSAIKELDILKNIDISLSNKMEKEITYAKLKSLQIENFIENKNLVDIEKIIKNIIGALDGIKSYQSRLIMRDYTNDKLKPKDYIFIEWRFGYEKPDKFSVEQYANENGCSVYDMWTSIGSSHYDLLPILGWIEEKDAGSIKNKNDLNYELSLKKYVKLIEQNNAGTINLYEENKDNAGYYIIKYNLPKWDFFKYDMKDVRYNIELWVDKNSLLLTKAIIKLNAKDEKSGKDIAYDFTQLFTNYNNIKIQPPTKVYVNQKSELMKPEELQEITGKW
jgi:hypothetical protein